MNARQRRTLTRLLTRHGVTIDHRPGLFYAWGAIVNGEAVRCEPPSLPISKGFTTKAAAIRCGVAHARKAP